MRPLPVHRDHRRELGGQRYVYAVVSRRSRGLSVGLNLNPDKVCNFDCVYCQVDRTTPGPTEPVDVGVLAAELDATLGLIASGAVWETEQFRHTPAPLRRLNDIAFAGDGEPTSCPVFLEAVRAAAEARRRHGLEPVKLVLITNATLLQRPRVIEALEVLAANNGEVWAKLEAGSEAYYQKIERTTIPLRRVLDNITAAARRAPLVIQALFLRLDGQGPTAAEQVTICDRLNEVRAAGGRIQRVQVYTVARRPAEPTVTALTDAEVDALAELVRRRTGLAVEAFYGTG
jgi:wyosine [tRNA(Phe)-imidazoG37] synthetase (radical SAM superfamily)